MKPTTQRHPLTHLQAQVLAYLVKFLHMNDQLPTCENIAAAFGWASSNSASLHLQALEKKGYLSRNELGNLMLADRPSEATPAQTIHHLIGQVLVLAGILEASLCVVRNVEVEGCSEGEQLSKLITRGDAAIAQVLKEHTMAATWCAGISEATKVYWVDPRSIAGFTDEGRPVFHTYKADMSARRTFLFTLSPTGIDGEARNDFSECLDARHVPPEFLPQVPDLDRKALLGELSPVLWVIRALNSGWDPKSAQTTKPEAAHG